MLKSINNQVQESIETKLREINGYFECLQKISFVNLDLIRRNLNHWQNFANASLAGDKKLLVNGYDFMTNLAKELRSSAEDSRHILQELNVAQNYLSQQQSSKAKDSLAGVDAFYAKSVNYWKDNLATFAGARN